MTNKITFKKVDIAHKEIIFSWLAEPHVQEFWDNTQGHKDDILNFMSGRKEPSNYCDGKYIYWISLASGKPYAMLMTIQATIKDDIGELRLSHLSKTGHTYGLDYMIGSTEYLGKGYGAKTLVEFVEFFRYEFDEKADTFLIDPASDNPRAKRVYEKAGFKHIADFVMSGDCSGSGKPHHLLIKQFPPIVNLVTASIDDYPLIQNMARFYVYDMSKECGYISEEWCLPPDGLFESFDFKSYFEEDSRQAYLVKVYSEVAGFVLLNKVTTEEKNDWNMGEFFILGKFQGKGIGKQVANQIWKNYPGLWEVSVIPENKLALKFWEHTIANYTNNTFKKETKIIDHNKDQPKRIIFTFDTHTESSAQPLFLDEKYREQADYVLDDNDFVKNLIHDLNDQQLVDLQKLYKQGWWSSKRTVDDCKKIVKNSSIIFGLVDHKKKLIAFSRVLTDYFLFSYVYDVLVDNEYQGLGLGRCLIEEIIHYPALQNVQNIELVCSKEMMRFYKKFGFSDSYGKSVSMRFVRGHK